MQSTFPVCKIGARRIDDAERELIAGGVKRKPATKVPWGQILSHGNLWVLAVMYFFYNL